MTLVAEPPHSPRDTSSRVVLHDIAWSTYEKLVNDVGNQHLLLTYDRGVLEIMAPSNDHEYDKKLLARLLEMYSFEQNIEIRSGGSTTWRRADLEKGLEPDECYHIQTEHLVSGRSGLDASNSPPPDLVIEMDLTHHAVNREAIYAALGVREIWKFNGERLEFLVLSQATYVLTENSAAFPLLASTDVQRFLKMHPGSSEQAILRKWIDWIRTQS